MDIQANGIATVSLKSVTMPPPIFGEIGDIFRKLDSDNSVRVVILRGGAVDKPHFSYGLDLKKAGPSFMGLKMEGTRMDLKELVHHWQEGFSAVARCRKPVIAAVQGWCIGAGLDLVSAADIRVCSQDAMFSLREAKIGIVADLGSLQRLPHIIGEATTRYLALTAGNLPAQRALAVGLVSHVYDDPDALYRGVAEMAGEMATLDGECLAGIKEVLDYGRDKSIEDGLRFVAKHNTAHLPVGDLAKHLKPK